MTTAVAEKPIEKTVRSMLRKYFLTRVTFTVTDEKVIARGHPQMYHPKQEERRQAAYAEAASKNPDGSLSISEASAINETFWKQPIAEARGETILEALDALTKELNALK